MTQYARDAVLATTGWLARVAVSPHGIEERFRRAARPPRRLSDCTPENPFRLLYVSIVDLYKHNGTCRRPSHPCEGRAFPSRST